MASKKIKINFNKTAPSALSVISSEEEGKKDLALSSEGYNPLKYITVDQQKYIRALVTSSMGEYDLAKAMGIKLSLLKQWNQNAHFLAYKHQCMQTLHDTEVADKIKKQQAYLVDKMFLDIMDRFEVPTPQELKEQENWTESQKEIYARRLFKNASAADAIKMYDIIAKNAIKLYGGDNQTQDKTEIVEEVRQRWIRKTKESQEWEDAFASAGIDPMKPFTEQVNGNGVIDIGPEKEKPSDNFESEVIEASIIRRRTVNGDKEK